MGKIDSDYLWLHERPQPFLGLRRLTLLLLVPLILGAAWFGVAPDSGRPSPGESRVRDVTTADTLDARIGIPDTSDRPAPAAASGIAAGGDPDTVSPIELPDPRPRIPLGEDGGLSAVTLDTLVRASDTTPVPIAAAPHRATSAGADTRNGRRWQNVTIRAGDTLSIAFNRNGLSYRDSLKIAHMADYGERFTRGLKAGDTLRVRANANGSVLALKYPLDALQTLEVHPDGNSFTGDVIANDVDHRKAYAVGVIDTSFYVDALESGLSDAQIMTLVKIFGWDIDFALDIRPGDRFIVVYDELYKDGDKIADGPILAASFINGDRDVRAVRYTRDDGKTAYYSPAGREMKKAFIRTPVDYTRISSGFSLARKHPILNRIRRHEGTDYAAPSGTPIKATGNGRMVFRGRRGGYGNMIIIRHDSHLTTRYGHMSRFDPDYGVGSKVDQGDVIGYVGMTGLATGPHLHYEFRVDGEPKNPETVKLPKALPLPDTELARFKRNASALLAQLDTLAHTMIARADDGAGTGSR